MDIKLHLDDLHSLSFYPGHMYHLVLTVQRERSNENDLQELFHQLKGYEKIYTSIHDGQAHLDVLKKADLVTRAVIWVENSCFDNKLYQSMFSCIEIH